MGFSAAKILYAPSELEQTARTRPLTSALADATNVTRPMKTEINGVTIAYDDQGTGPPIVFLHAFPLNRTMWAPQAAVLSRRFRTISIDLRGLGESDAPYWRYSLEQYASGREGSLGRAWVSIRPCSSDSRWAATSSSPCIVCIRNLMLGLVLADTRAEADKPEQIQWRFNLAQRTAAMGPAAVIAEMLPKLLAPGAMIGTLISWLASDP